MTAVTSKPILERHIQTLLLTVVAGLIAWQGVTTLKLIETSTRQDERITYLVQQVGDMHAEMRRQRDDYVTRAEFERRLGEFRAVLERSQ